MSESEIKETSQERIASCAAILERPLPVKDDEKIEDVCPRPDAMPMGPSERSVYYKGHVVKVKTSYEITIDGMPFTRHIGVNEKGQAHCHALPYLPYESTLDLVCGYIDGYPDLLPEPTADHDCEESE